MGPDKNADQIIQEASKMPKLYEYAILYLPKTSKDAAGNDTTPPAQLLLEPTYFIAENEQQVAMLAARKIPEAYVEKLAEVQIAIRPF